jgi:hypothetical protein
MKIIITDNIWDYSVEGYMVEFGITQTDLTNLKSFQPVIEADWSNCISEFYSQLRQYENFEDFFHSEEIVIEVADKQRDYWFMFFKGEITEHYISERVRVGEVHARINLPLKTYIAGINIFSDIFAKLMNKDGVDIDNPFQVISSINKVLNLDASIVVSTYAHIVNKILSDKSHALEEEISERKKVGEELEKRTKQAEQFNKMAVNRELRMIEMKKEVDELLVRLGEKARYS